MEFCEESIIYSSKRMNVFIIICKRNFLPDHSYVWACIKAWFFFCLNELTISISSNVRYRLFFNAHGWLVSVTLSVSLLYYDITFNIFRHVFVMFTNCAGRTTSTIIVSFIFLWSFIDYWTLAIASSFSASNILMTTITGLHMCT